MKIHMRPLPPAPPPKPPTPSFWLEMQAEELVKTAQQQQTRLKRLYGARKSHQDLGEDTDSEKHELDHPSRRNLDFIV